MQIAKPVQIPKNTTLFFSVSCLDNGGHFSSVFKRALTGEHHGDLRGGLVASLDGFVIAHGAAGLKNSGNAFADPYIRGIAERKKASEIMTDPGRPARSALTLVSISSLSA